MFVGREQELVDLDREFRTSRASLGIVYGRRRVGKSTLLQHAAEHHGKFVYFQATKVDESLNLSAFKSEIARIIGAAPLLDGIGDWAGVLHYLARAAETHRGLVVIIDEFPYLLDGRDSLTSVIQKFWDSKAAERGNLKVVLCGSLIAHMESLLSERNPLHGRRTFSLSLEPMSLREAAEFLPDYSAAEQIAAYATFGGIPHYLQMCDPHAPLQENIERLLLAKTGALFEEPEFLLQSELKEPRRYASIVAAIARGGTKLGQIVTRVPGIKDTAQVTPYLEPLIRMRIVERIRSLDADENSRDNRYYVSDPLFRFYYRFILPNASPISLGFGGQVYEQQIQPHLADYMGWAFEQVCRNHIRLHAQERFGAPASEIGKIWGPDFDIDIAGSLLDQSRLFGECKWENALLGESIHRDLLENVSKSKFATEGRTQNTVYFSRKGFTDGLRKLAATDASVQLIGTDELVKAPAYGWNGPSGP
ncbi:AAA+ ATPase superfamily predicted ATPase [Bradyrhizobium sp. AZCC 1578]|uniref:ATP-binding protein n=1 Tax=Bradyrhizobium sp. AZCC 1578 TaxID=3117027 RepID=UPI002FEEF6C6